jgi:hypothetical protein
VLVKLQQESLSEEGTSRVQPQWEDNIEIDVEATGYGIADWEALGAVVSNVSRKENHVIGFMYVALLV